MKEKIYKVSKGEEGWGCHFVVHHRCSPPLSLLSPTLPQHTTYLISHLSSSTHYFHLPFPSCYLSLFIFIFLFRHEEPMGVSICHHCSCHSSISWFLCCLWKVSNNNFINHDLHLMFSPLPFSLSLFFPSPLSLSPPLPCRALTSLQPTKDELNDFVAAATEYANTLQSNGTWHDIGMKEEEERRGEERRGEERGRGGEMEEDGRGKRRKEGQ